MAQQTEDVRWLLVGTGDIASKRVAPALKSTDGGQLLAVCSRDRAKGQAFADRFGIPKVYDDLADALKGSDANAVYLATPVDCHIQQAEEACRAGRHVLIEKPLGINAGDAAIAVNAVRTANVLGACAYYRRCSTRYLHAEKIIKSGLLGRILLVRMVYHAWFNPAKDDPKFWRVQQARGGGGVLADMGCHMIDVMVGLLGTPRSIFAKSKTLMHGYEAEDTASFLMEMPEGAQVVGSFGWSSQTWANEFEIIGSEGKLKWAPFDSGQVVLTVGRDIHELNLPPAENVHQPLVADFHNALRNGLKPACPLEDAMKTNVILDAIYRSAATGREECL
jgi:predicted dehydrogenase